MNSFSVIQIAEKDFGCEEVPEGQSRMDEVRLRAADGTCRTVDMPDRLLAERNIEEGTAVTILPDGTLRKE